jgi:hypothetical protein
LERVYLATTKRRILNLPGEISKAEVIDLYLSGNREGKPSRSQQRS